MAEVVAAEACSREMQTRLGRLARAQEIDDGGGDYSAGAKLWRWQRAEQGKAEQGKGKSSRAEQSRGGGDEEMRFRPAIAAGPARGDICI